MLVHGAASAQQNAQALEPGDVPGLICFWDFQEPGGEQRHAKGPHDYPLKERHGPIKRVEEGIWGPYSVQVNRGQWFSIDRADCPALNIHGKGAQYTILAWVKRLDSTPWQFVAGMWDEADSNRQYGLFLNAGSKTDSRTFKRTPAKRQVHAYVSAEGGATPGHTFCHSYASGGTVLENGQWYFIAATYDQQALRVYVDGQLDTLEHYNPFPYPGKAIHDGGKNGAMFTVANRAIPGWRGYPESQFKHDGFAGLIGGLAVYNRALTAEQIRQIHAGAETERRKHRRVAPGSG
ncbi:LamG domain-containing protein [Planctomycetales bacterium ZRK34]|nr:LamG domain-containing protein [Planctomycetales bacterium ZRK34]